MAGARPALYYKGRALGIEYGKYGVSGSGKYSQLSRVDPNAPLPPGLVSLQIAYDGGADIALLNGKPVAIIDSINNISLNIDSGSQKIYSDYNAELRGGATTHLINQPITSSLTITQNQLDRVNINSTDNAYIYTLPDDTLNAFPDGSQFELLQIGSNGQITLNWPTAVAINGVFNSSIVLNAPYQRCAIRKIAKNVYTSPVGVAPIKPTDGIFTPVITASTGLLDASGENGLYSANSTTPGSVVEVTMRLLVKTDSSGSNCTLTINTPIPVNFTDFFQVEICGNPLIVEDTPDEDTGNIGSGWGKSLRAVGGNSIYFVFEAANTSTIYYVNLSYKCQIQAALLAKKPFNQHKNHRKLLYV